MARKKSLKDIEDQVLRIRALAGNFRNYQQWEIDKGRVEKARDIAHRYNENIFERSKKIVSLIDKSSKYWEKDRDKAIKYYNQAQNLTFHQSTYRGTANG